MTEYAKGGYVGGGYIPGSPKPWNGYCDNLYRMVLTPEQYEHVMTRQGGAYAPSGTIMVTLTPEDAKAIMDRYGKK